MSTRPFARQVAVGFGQSITAEQLALLTEFDGDTAAVNRLMNDLCNGGNGAHGLGRCPPQKHPSRARIGRKPETSSGFQTMRKPGA
jgi:hypothetical protein